MPEDVQEVTIPESPKASAPPFDNFKTYVPGDLAVTPDGQTWKMVTYIGAAGYYPSAPDWEKVPSGSGRSGKSLTLYHADWCHFCTKLMPTWKKLGSEYKGIKIVTNEEKQNKSFPVDGYPTIVYRDGSTMEKYEGKRTKAAIVNFLKSKL
jgi:thiol-disulfide isomerase/thioredoxin